jgi:hypothetical protein
VGYGKFFKLWKFCGKLVKVRENEEISESLKEKQCRGVVTAKSPSNFSFFKQFVLFDITDRAKNGKFLNFRVNF